MCRFIAYLGREVLLADLIIKPQNSLVRQSLHARESQFPTNGDGFGLGWYVPSVSHEPALFTAIQPAWNDRNLLNLVQKIKSNSFFAHVRAASFGGVSQLNCHPFVYGRWMLMHNGDINHFFMIKRHLRRFLDDDLYNWIQGETDSEHFFALFLQFAKGKDLSIHGVVADILLQTIEKIKEWIDEYAEPGPTFLNLCLTDGKRLWSTRYCSDLSLEPESLHYAIGQQFEAIEGHYHVIKKHPRCNSILVTSEQLTDCADEWQPVPKNHLLSFDEEHRLHLRKI